MDDDLLVPPHDAPVGELVTVKGHPPTPSKNTSAVSVIWDKVLNEELLQVGDDEVSYVSLPCGVFFPAPVSVLFLSGVLGWLG